MPDSAFTLATDPKLECDANNLKIAGMVAEDGEYEG